MTAFDGKFTPVLKVDVATSTSKMPRRYPPSMIIFSSLVRPE